MRILRRILAATVLGGVALPMTMVGTSSAAPRTAAAPPKPVITSIQGTSKHYAHIVFKVHGTGYTVVQARGEAWVNSAVVDHCGPALISTSGPWIDYVPAGPGMWSFQLRVKNAGGWSPWSAQSRHVRVS